MQRSSSWTRDTVKVDLLTKTVCRQNVKLRGNLIENIAERKRLEQVSALAALALALALAPASVTPSSHPPFCVCAVAC